MKGFVGHSINVSLHCKILMALQHEMVIKHTENVPLLEAESIHKGFKCVICDIPYGDKKDLNEHRARSNKMVMLYNCGICNAGFFW